MTFIERAVQYIFKNVFLLILAGICIISGGIMVDASQGVSKSKNIVLVGASIGYGWKIQELPKRMHGTENTFEYVGEDGFDKGKKLEEILKRSKKPDAIIIKECAAYFPGDLNRYQALVEGWLKACDKKGVIPILATVVPVRDPAFWKLQYWKNIVKKMIYPEKATVAQRLDSLYKYNDWIRGYAARHNIVVLDLEETLRISKNDRRLKPEYDAGDGLHINSQAYAVLDKALADTLKNVKWGKK